MTEQEAIKAINLNKLEVSGPAWRMAEFCEALAIAQEALEEIQRYRVIGTPEECQATREELKTAKEAIRKLLCSEYGSTCQFCEQDNNADAMCRKVGGSGSWCCKNARWNGRLE